MGNQALEGLRVVDFTHYVAGPFCTKLMADYGAEVIKIERPHNGDGARRMGPFAGDDPHPEKSGLFFYLNTNKKSVTLDLKTKTGLRLARDLIKDADVVVENFKPGVMSRLGLDYEGLEALNPRLVMTSVSNYGQSGPFRDDEATSLINYATGGYLYSGGEPGKEPLRSIPSLPELQAGLHASAATMMAQFAAETTGVGQHVDVSIMEVMGSIHQYALVAYAHMGVVRERSGARYVGAHPLTILPCKDGYAAVTSVTVPQWEMTCLLMEEPQLLDPKYALGGDRFRCADEVDELMAPWLRAHTGEEIFHTAQGMRLPFGLVPTVAELLKDPHFRTRELFVESEHPQMGTLTTHGAPFKMGETPWTQGRAPLLGEHNLEVLGDRLGCSRADLISLRENGVI